MRKGVSTTANGANVRRIHYFEFLDRIYRKLKTELKRPYFEATKLETLIMTT